ncbi:MAG: hypothetical protein LBT36_05055, partial [Oscillospiraceae bacterium]|nr:hypothetical protein [Oscillospiraceae bacterium]
MTDLQRARRALTLAKRLAGRADGAPRLTWLRENYYLAQREFNVSADELRRGRFARARLPRVFTAARAYLDGCGARVGEASLEAFLSAESSEPFTERELGALLPAVRLELVARVAETARRAASETSGEEADAEFETLFTSLRLLADFDPSEVFARVNRVERILRRDPAGLYARLDETTRASYREAVARAAARKHITEEAAATDALANARAAQTHIGDALFAPVSQRGGALYIAANIAITAALTLLFARTYGRGAY